MKKTMAVLLGCVLISGVLYAANEISVNITLIAEKGYSKVDRQPGSISITWVNANKYGPIDFVAGQTYTAFARGIVASNGVFYVRNTSTNLDRSIYLSFNGGTNDHLKLPANENAIMRLEPAGGIGHIMYRCQPTNLTVQGEYVILEN